jgi:hypothetical protein
VSVNANVFRKRNQSPQTQKKYWLKMSASVSMCPLTLSVLRGVKCSTQNNCPDNCFAAVKARQRYYWRNVTSICKDFLKISGNYSGEDQ